MGIVDTVVGGVIPILIVLATIAFLVGLKVAASRYKKVPPGRVGIFYGMKYKDKDGHVKGFMVMSGGGRVQRPLVEGYLEVPTTSFQVDINETGIPNKDNVKLTVPGVATCKISTQPENLTKAIEALIDKLTQENDPKRGGQIVNPIEEFVRNILKGHLRSIIGKLDIDELLRKRDEFNKRVIEESAAELSAFGIELQNLVIQDIQDDLGYIDALGKKVVAMAIADAAIESSNAEKKQKTIEAGNAVEVAEAENTRDLQKAAFLQTKATKEAEANMAGQIATAAQQERLVVAEAQRDKAQKTAQVGVQQEEQKRKTAELAATTVATATAEAEKTVIVAKAAAEAATANKAAAIAAAEGSSQATRLTMIATAEGNAASERAKLVAQAEGTERLNAALANMTDAARLILILDRLPVLLDKGGTAGAQVLGSMFGPIAAGLANIDSIRIVDMGGNGKGIDKMSGVVTDTVFQVLAQLKAKGIDVSKLGKMLGVDLSGLETLLDGVAPASTGTGSSAPASPATE